MNISVKIKDGTITLHVDNMIRLIHHFKQLKTVTTKDVLQFFQNNPTIKP